MYRSRNAFTLLELLVVIFIIGLLMAVLVTAVGGGTNAARSAKCLANMRNLATGAVSIAMRDEYYPLAGSVEWYEITYNPQSNLMVYHYYERQGWIGWDSRGTYHGNNGSVHQSQVTKGFPNWYRSTYDVNKGEWTKSRQDENFIRRGTMWGFVKNNREMFLCPEHRKAIKKIGKKYGVKDAPYWSYVMSERFGWQAKGKEGPYHGENAKRVEYGNISRPDKTIIFAEMNWTEIPGCAEPKITKSAGTDCDCVLQYSSNSERIGFNHISGNDMVAHVAFADAHVEIIRLPRGTTNEQQLRDLTHCLCAGKDWALEKGKYKEIK